MRFQQVALLVSLGLLSLKVSSAADLIVICNPSVSLKAEEVRDVYFGDKAFAGSVKLAPADNSAAQAAFLEKVMHVDARKYAGVWIKKSFRDGSTPPPLRTNDAETITYVKQTPGACGYVESPPGDGVVVIAKF